MADNITAKANVGAGTEVLAADDVGGVLFPRTKIALGADGVSDGDVSAANPLPITGTVTVGNASVAVTGSFWQSTQPVSVAALPLPSGAATDAGLATISAQLAGTLAVSGSFYPATQPVSGTFWQATQPVSLASSVAVTGTFWQATQPVSAASLPLPSGASTDATLAALSAKVPAQGAAATAASLPVNIANDQTVMVSKVDATASGTITTQNLVAAGTATAGSAVEISTAGKGTITFQVEGTYTGALSVQGRVNSTGAWVTLSGVTTLVNAATGAQSATVVSAAAGIYQCDAGGFTAMRVTGLAAMTGTATVNIRATDAVALTALDTPLPTGANTIGAVTVTGTMTPVINTAQGAGTLHHAISAATTNATSVKAAAGTVNAIVLSNASAAVKFVKIYNKASAPTVGTDTPIATILVPVAGTVVFPCGAYGTRFSAGIAYAITGAIAVADTTAVAAGDVSVHIQYI